MLLSITTTHAPATDLAFLLHKHPNRHQSFELRFGNPEQEFVSVNEKELEYMRWLSSRYVELVRKYQAGQFGEPSNS